MCMGQKISQDFKVKAYIYNQGIIMDKSKAGKDNRNSFSLMKNYK